MSVYYDPVACEDVNGTERIFRLLSGLEPGDPQGIERVGGLIAATVNEMSKHERGKFLSGLMLMMNDLRLRVQALEAAAASAQLRPPSSIIQ